jgi:hypothetical protein
VGWSRVVPRGLGGLGGEQPAGGRGGDFLTVLFSNRMSYTRTMELKGKEPYCEVYDKPNLYEITMMEYTRVFYEVAASSGEEALRTDPEKWVEVGRTMKADRVERVIETPLKKIGGD